MMPIRDILLAVLVVLIWGCNFIFIKISLTEFSPLFLCAVRFFLASVPAIFFIKPPKAPAKMIILYGLVMFGLQFALLFMGMKAGMTPGLAALLTQVQIFFSIFFAAIFFDEKPLLVQVIGALVAFSGMGFIAMHFEHNVVTLTGFILIIAAAAVWGAGNLMTKKIKHVNMLALVVWGSFVACLPLLLLSLIFEGPATIVDSIHHVTWLGAGSVFYIVFASTWIGYGIWGKLVGQYPVATIVPFTLLVPVFGMLSSYLILGEPLQSWKLMSGLLVITGLCINLLGARFVLRKSKV